jgi:hypothetical protein
LGLGNHFAVEHGYRSVAKLARLEFRLTIPSGTIYDGAAVGQGIPNVGLPRPKNDYNDEDDADD